ncbi:MAG: T9SS type A sorting domain-containing protein, partial [Bacteroidota bacterium]
DHSRLKGYQFTLNFDMEQLALVEVQEGVAKRNHFAQPEKGKLTLSWNGESQAQEVLSLVFHTQSAVNFAKALHITSDVTAAEVYLTNGDLKSAQLQFNTTATTEKLRYLYQNEPNPFDESTNIAFELSTEEEATLTIRDLNGKIVFEQKAIYGTGKNEITIKRKVLPAGVLFYTLKVDGYSVTKRMVVL